MSEGPKTETESGTSVTSSVNTRAEFGHGVAKRENEDERMMQNVW